MRCHVRSGAGSAPCLTLANGRLLGSIKAHHELVDRPKVAGKRPSPLVAPGRLSFRYPPARPFPVHRRLRFQGTGQYSPAWYDPGAVAPPAGFSSCGRLAWLLCAAASGCQSRRARGGLRRPINSRPSHTGALRGATSGSCGSETGTRPGSSVPARSRLPTRRESAR